MKLKDLVMQTTYNEIEQAIANVFASFDLEITNYRKSKWEQVFDTLCAMKPEQNVDMKLRVVPGDVSGYYDEEAREKNSDYTEHMYSLTATPWSEWLGMEVDEATLTSMSVADILGNCIYEMTWWGYDEETIHKNFEERLGKRDAGKTEGDGETKIKVDSKTQCVNFIKSFIPAILPSVAQKLDDPKFEQTLVEANCQENGAYCEPIDLEPFEMPLTGIAFFYIYINGNCMMGVSTEIEGQFSEIVYNWFAPFAELKTMIDTDEAQNAIADILVGQVNNYFKE
jgi:hypothetical protein